MRQRRFTSRLRERAERLAAARGLRPPIAIDIVKDEIDHINNLIRTAKGVWLGMLAYLAYVGVTLLGVEDADFFLTERQTELPLIGVSIPTNLFFWVSPALGAMLFVYLHQYLLKLWEELAAKPPQIDGKILGDLIAPWLVADFALSLRRDGAIRPLPLWFLAESASVCLVFLAAPIVLAGFFIWSMPNHNEFLTIAACGGPLVICLIVALASWLRLRRLSRKVDILPLWGRKVTIAIWLAFLFVFGQAWLKTEGTLKKYAEFDFLPLSLAMPVISNFFDISEYTVEAIRAEFSIGGGNKLSSKINERISAVSINDIWRIDQYDKILKIYSNYSDVYPQDLRRTNLATFVTSMEKTMSEHSYKIEKDIESKFWMVDLAPDKIKRANLYNVVLVQNPPGWLPYDEAEREFRFSWCGERDVTALACGPGPILKRDIIASNGVYSEPAKVALARQKWCKDFLGDEVTAPTCSEFFSDLDEGYDYNWRLARIGFVQSLPKRDLSYVDLRGADMRYSEMNGINLSNARLEGANFSDAEMEGANLTNASMAGVDLSNSSLQGADLSDARMEGADLIGARMEGAHLRGAWMEGAFLIDARMEGVDLRGARMEGAHLLGARFDAATDWTDADVSRARAQHVDFSATPISMDQVNSMFGDASVTLPKGITPNHPDWPAHWPKEDLDPFAFDTAYQSWLDSQR